MKFPKLIASDLDGTLMTEGSHDLSERAIDLIEEYLDRGGVFVAASGRQYENMRDLFGRVSDRIAYICYSGGLCLSGGEVVYSRCIEPELAGELIPDIEAEPGCAAMLSVRGSEIISPKEPRLYSFLTDSIGAYADIVPDLTAIADGIYKISLYNHDECIDRDRWKADYSDRCSVLVSGRVWIDFIPTGVHKGTALEALISRMGISPDDCVAFGDNENDSGMLKLVGCPVAMASSAPHIRALGKYTTDSVENALEKILRS